MADHEALGGAGETAVRDQGDIAGQALADQGCRNAQHFPHAGTALGALIADDDDIAGLDRVGFDGGEGVFLAFKDTGRPGEFRAVMAGQFQDGALRGQVTGQDAKAAIGFDGVGDGMDDALVFRFGGACAFSVQALSGHGRRVGQQAALDQALTEQARAAGQEHVVGQETTAGFQVGDDRCLAGNAVEIGNVERNAGLGGDGSDMQDGIGRTARGRGGDDGIAQRGLGDETARRGSGLCQRHGQAAAPGCRRRLVGMRGRNVVHAHRRQAQHGQDHRHRVGGELAATGPGAGTGGLFDLGQTGIVQRAGRVSANRFEHVLDRQGLVAQPARHDRAAIEDAARHIHTGQGHGGGRNGLVAPDQDDNTIQAMPAGRQLDRVGDDLA